MVSVSSHVTIRYVRLSPTGEGDARSTVPDILVHAGESSNLLFVLHRILSKKSLLAIFDMETWRCVSRCDLDDHPYCMYQMSGDVYVHCEGRGLYRVSSLSPLSVTRHGQTDGYGAWAYRDIAVVNDSALMAVDYYYTRVYLLHLNGQMSLDVSTECRCGKPWKISSQNGVVAVLDALKSYPDKSEISCQVVCVTVAGNDVTYKWTSQTLATVAMDILITSRVVLVSGRHPESVLVTLSIETGAVIRVTKLFSPVWRGLCEIESRIYAGGEKGKVLEIQPQGKLLSCSP
jgi:hypothetical protein